MESHNIEVKSFVWGCKVIYIRVQIFQGSVLVNANSFTKKKHTVLILIQFNL
jgi:hypothetical protein